MGETKVKKKGLIQAVTDNIEDELKLINEHTIKTLSADDVYMFKVELCDNDIDRVGDKMSVQFLEEVANNVTGLTGLKDHDWNSDNQMARLYGAEVMLDEDNVTSLGEPRKYVLGKAYTLRTYKEYIDKIDAGLLKETSISFESHNDTCSICGTNTIKIGGGMATCENGHIANEVYDGILCHNNINELKDMLEWSLVAVPCQRKSKIKNKSMGGNSVENMKALLNKFKTSKAYQEADEEEKALIDEAVGEEEEVELTEEEIKKIVSENNKLKSKVKSLEEKVKEAEQGRQRDKTEIIVGKSIDELNPLTPKVREMMIKDIPWDELVLEGEEVKGLAEVIEGIKEGYEGLLGADEEIVEALEEVVEEIEVVEETEEVKEEEVEEVVETVKEKKLTRPTGMHFGVSHKSYEDSTKQVNKRKAGMYFGK